MFGNDVGLRYESVEEWTEDCDDEWTEDCAEEWAKE